MANVRQIRSPTLPRLEDRARQTRRAEERTKPARNCALALGCALLALGGAVGVGRAPAARGVRLTAAHPRAARAQILFGLGPEADGARRGALAGAAPVRMLSSWYNGPADLTWMAGWKNTEIRRDYAAGFALHLIVWSGGPQTAVGTPYGTACGQAYPLSAGFQADMRRLALIFRPPRHGRLYVTLFSELQTYACGGNDWAAGPQTTAYFKALKAQYRRALALFHRLAPHSVVSLGWGGWQARWDDPSVGGGRSLFKHFADVMRASDFESFEVINSDSDAQDMLAMTRELGRFGPVMLAYYRPSEGASATVHADLQSVLAPSFLSRLIRNRLFALSFMDERFIDGDPAGLAIVADAVRRFGCRGCGLRR